MEIEPTRRRLRCLDLFCCAGGAATGLHRAGFEVTGVDVVPQPRYPFSFIQGDALKQDLSQFDFVWASPPCQAYSTLKTMPNLRKHEKLIPSVRNMLEEWGGPWIIENVEGSKRELRDPVMLCGSMFGLESNGYQVRRHRYKEKRHYAKPKETRGKPCGVVLPQAWGLEAMGVSWMNIKEACECIPPAYSEYLGRQVITTHGFRG